MANNSVFTASPQFDVSIDTGQTFDVCVDTSKTFNVCMGAGKTFNVVIRNIFKAGAIRINVDTCLLAVNYIVHQITEDLLAISGESELIINGSLLHSVLEAEVALETLSQLTADEVIIYIDGESWILVESEQNISAMIYDGLLIGEVLHQTAEGLAEISIIASIAKR